MVKAAYAHATYKSTFAMMGRFNTSFLANPWQYKYGICTNNDNNAYHTENDPSSCHGNQLMAAALM